jgi:membrane-bound lytic murein transglycosylase B
MEDEREHEKKDDQEERGLRDNYEDGGRKKRQKGYVVSTRSVRLIVGGALGALAALCIGKTSARIRPTVVGAVKEGYAFKEWVAGKCEKAREDIEDIVAEAKHAHYSDLKVTSETLSKEKEILQKIEETVNRRMARNESEKEGA